jgi:predicted transcriptional regulator
MKWDQVNWAEVFVYTSAIAVLLGIVTLFLSSRMESMATSIHLQYLDEQREQLRKEIARAAQESLNHQDEMRQIVQSVVALAETVKKAICSHEPVDEKASREAFSRLEGQLSNLESYHRSHDVPAPAT